MCVFLYKKCKENNSNEPKYSTIKILEISIFYLCIHLIKYDLSY